MSRIDKAYLSFPILGIRKADMNTILVNLSVLDFNRNASRGHRRDIQISLAEIIRMTDFMQDYTLVSGKVFTPIRYVHIGSIEDFDSLFASALRYCHTLGYITSEEYVKIAMKHFDMHYESCYRNENRKAADFLQRYVLPILDVDNMNPDLRAFFTSQHPNVLEAITMGTIKPDVLLELTRYAMLKCQRSGYYERTVKGEVYGFFTRDDKVRPLTSCKKVIRDYYLKDKFNFLFEQFGLLKSE